MLAQDFEQQFLDQHHGLYYQSDGSACVNYAGEILWTSPRFCKTFKLRSPDVRGRTLTEVLAIAGLSDWIQLRHGQIIAQCRFLTSEERREYLSYDYVYSGGNEAIATIAGIQTQVIVTIAPLLIQKSLYMGVFFNRVGDLPSADRWINYANLAAHLWKTQRGLVLVGAIAALTGIAIWHAEAISKLVTAVKPAHPVVTPKTEPKEDCWTAGGVSACCTKIGNTLNCTESSPSPLIERLTPKRN
jgi:hypothetical protein